MSVYLFVPRAKTYAFEEFLGNWYQKLKEHDPTTMTVRLQKDIDMYKVSLRSILDRSVFVPIVVCGLFCLSALI